MSIPKITFVLFTAVEGAPPFHILTNASKVNEDLEKYAKEYMRLYVRTRRENYTIILPCLIKTFMQDFTSEASNSQYPGKGKGASKGGHKFIHFLLDLTDGELRKEITAIFSTGKSKGELVKPKFMYDNLNWTPICIL
jgi:hypothetical protein